MRKLEQGDKLTYEDSGEKTTMRILGVSGEALSYEISKGDKPFIFGIITQQGIEKDPNNWKLEYRPWEPKIGGKYYTPNIHNNDFYEVYYFNNISDERRFKRGLAFKTKEEAIACAKKMLDSIK